MLPESLLRVARVGGEGILRYLTARDEVWLGDLLGEMRGLVGKTVDEIDGEVDSRIVPNFWAIGAGARAVRGAMRVLSRSWPSKVVAAARPAEIRQTLFELASAGLARQEALARTATSLHIPESEVLPGLFADRPGARRLVAPTESPSPSRLAELYNLALLQGVLLRSFRVLIRTPTHGQSVVRNAKLKRLICTCSIDDGCTRIELSGPLALFRQTTRYGHALASFVPALVATPGWSLRANCVLRDEQLLVCAQAGDPIARTHAAARDTESAVEKRLLRDVRRLGTPWIIERETTAVRAGRAVFFPDFTLRRGAEQVHVEIVGHYTADYLTSKLQTLRSAGIENFVVCVDDSLACSSGAIEPAPVLRYRRSIDACALLGLADKVSASRRADG